MSYERTQQIEHRLNETIDLISRKGLNANQLASELDVSLPTIQRSITALRRRGYKIRSVRDELGWRYEFIGGPNG